MLVLPPRTVERIAERIERAYRRRHVERYRGGEHSGVWGVVANTLVDLHRADPSLPLDPELFVAAQRRNTLWADPWQDLAAASSVRRYRRTVRKIVRQLREEIRGELRHATALKRRKGSLETIVCSRSTALSPLGRYILAHREGRPDLAEQVRSDACDQHWSCPLYRRACAAWIPPGAYPVSEVLPFGNAHAFGRLESAHSSLN